MLDRSLRGVVLLHKVLVEARQALVLRFRPTTLDVTLKPFKVLHRDNWQSWISGAALSRCHEDGGSVLLCERGVLPVLSP